MNRVDRLLALLLFLQSRRVTTAERMAHPTVTVIDPDELKTLLVKAALDAATHHGNNSKPS